MLQHMKTDECQSKEEHSEQLPAELYVTLTGTQNVVCSQSGRFWRHLQISTGACQTAKYFTKKTYIFKNFTWFFNVEL